jgi:hypothetical protein
VHDAEIVRTIEFSIIWDAAALVNLQRKRAKANNEEFAQIIKGTFRTEEGLRIATEVFLGDTDERKLIP